jgi:Holliday junction resolvase-like predicted endonuclease
VTSSTAYTRKLAHDYLESSGAKILDRDWSSANGVLSFIGPDGDTLVVYAVDERDRKDTRRSEIDEFHAARLRRMGVEWMKAHNLLYPRLPGPGGLRVDLIVVTRLPLGQNNIEHVKGVGQMSPEHNHLVQGRGETDMLIHLYHAFSLNMDTCDNLLESARKSPDHMAHIRDGFYVFAAGNRYDVVFKKETS